MFSNTDLPRNWSLLITPRSPPVRVKAGAGDPTAGSSPTVLIAFPRRVICAMGTVCQDRCTVFRAGLRRRRVLICAVCGVDARPAPGQHWHSWREEWLSWDSPATPSTP
ncbi:Uncharacterised protein [Mycobacterium tuberculosis]|uniref:Uncharacterized protein n=1 Tax=Mycobacterium tuberculosis TaxID=1773 RepID=A0A916PC84_MYCTX|nr:Uncharacterised protein [Mycobacterium tuberculosis]COY64115.1 Uncharacterised protein [Mycobacterium tuberculosis]